MIKRDKIKFLRESAVGASRKTRFCIVAFESGERNFSRLSPYMLR